MTDTVLQSFCERCGTRFTVELPQQKPEPPPSVLGRFKRKSPLTIDDSGFPPEYPASEHFKGTFHFCLECRRYNCPECWNEQDGYCISCHPPGATLDAGPAMVASAALSEAAPGGAKNWPPDVAAGKATGIAAEAAGIDQGRRAGEWGEVDEWGRPRTAQPVPTVAEVEQPADPAQWKSTAEQDPWRGVVFSSDQAGANLADSTAASEMVADQPWATEEGPAASPPGLGREPAAWPDGDRKLEGLEEDGPPPALAAAESHVDAADWARASTSVVGIGSAITATPSQGPDALSETEQPELPDAEDAEAAASDEHAPALAEAEITLPADADVAEATYWPGEGPESTAEHHEAMRSAAVVIAAAEMMDEAEPRIEAKADELEAEADEQAEAEEQVEAVVTAEAEAEEQVEAVVTAEAEAEEQVEAVVTAEAEAEEQVEAVVTAEAEAAEQVEAVVTAEAEAEEQVEAVVTAEAEAAEQVEAVVTAEAEAEEQVEAVVTAEAEAEEQVEAVVTAEAEAEEQVEAVVTAEAEAEEQVEAVVTAEAEAAAYEQGKADGLEAEAEMAEPTDASDRDAAFLAAALVAQQPVEVDDTADAVEAESTAEDFAGEVGPWKAADELAEVAAAPESTDADQAPEPLPEALADPRSLEEPAPIWSSEPPMPQAPLAPAAPPRGLEVWSVPPEPGPFAQPYQLPAGTTSPLMMSAPTQPGPAPAPPMAGQQIVAGAFLASSLPGDAAPQPPVPTPTYAPDPAPTYASPPPLVPPPPQQMVTPSAYLQPPPPPRQQATTRACPNCALPISTKARFCRRCGTPQPG